MKLKILSILCLSVTIVLFNTCSQNPAGPENKFLSWPPENIDTTSHNFTWQIDTLESPGAFQILPNGIWGADTNDVWVVAHSDDWKARIWHWDGKTWTAWAGGALGVSPNDIIGFSKDDIWLAGRRIGNNPVIKSIRHWDGQDWNIVEHNIETDIRSLWGSSSDNMFFGLNDGRIARYNGVGFKIEETGTEAQILDLHGILDNEVYAVGIERDKVQPFDSTGYYIFKYVDKKWKVNNFFHQTKDSPTLGLPIRGLWSDDFGYYLGVNSSGVYSYDGKEWAKTFELPGALTLNGTSVSNIFTSGNDGSSIFHFNGKTWKSFEELIDVNLFTRTNSVLKDHVFIPGSVGFKAYIIRGRRWSN